MGSIMTAVAVFEIQSEMPAVATSIPKSRRLGRVPMARMMSSATRRPGSRVAVASSRYTRKSSSLGRPLSPAGPAFWASSFSSATSGPSALGSSSCAVR